MMRYDVREVEIQANITTQSDEANWNDNSYTIALYFDVDIDIAIAGLVLDENINLKIDIAITFFITVFH